MSHETLRPRAGRMPQFIGGIALFVSIVGIGISIPLTLISVLGFAEWLNRTDCTPETLGSDCYEGQFGLSLVIHGVVLASFFVSSLLFSLWADRLGRRNWWTFSLLCATAASIFSLLGSAIYFSSKPEGLWNADTAQYSSADVEHSGWERGACIRSRSLAETPPCRLIAVARNRTVASTRRSFAAMAGHMVCLC